MYINDLNFLISFRLGKFCNFRLRPLSRVQWQIRRKHGRRTERKMWRYLPLPWRKSTQRCTMELVFVQEYKYLYTRKSQVSVFPFDNLDFTLSKDWFIQNCTKHSSNTVWYDFLWISLYIGCRSLVGRMGNYPPGFCRTKGIENSTIVSHTFFIHCLHTHYLIEFRKYQKQSSLILVLLV